jgi:transcriptional regulator with PAS, ATPase and Fis domain
VAERRPLASTITGARAPDARVRPASCALHVVFPPEARATFRLREQETAVGRDPGLEGLTLDHATISRRHAAFTWSATRGAHAVHDLGSRNGTTADGVAATAEPRPLVHGSLVRLGDTVAVYEQDDDRDAPDPPAVSREAIPGVAAGVRRLRALVARAAIDPAAALIIGETGTGKERLAGEVHRLSGRAGKLIAVNCAALSPELVESQLFGHVKGAFTGAGDAQPGLFRAAHGGTLFLDEVGDLPLPLQPKLLRALQEGEVLPVGATQAVRVDVRVVAATHRDLVGAIAARTFREDLYARLATWELPVPPLRDRRVDLLGWIERLHAQWTAARNNAPPLPRFDADAAEALLRFTWPLNLRGVQRLVHELATAEGAGPTIGRAALPAWLGVAPSVSAPEPAVAGPRADAPPTREEFIRAFEQLGGSVHGLAKRFNRDRRQIYRWLKAYDLREGRD